MDLVLGGRIETNFCLRRWSRLRLDSSRWRILIFDSEFSSENLASWTMIWR